MNEVFRFVTIEAPAPPSIDPEKLPWHTGTQFYGELAKSPHQDRFNNLFSLATAYTQSTEFISNENEISFPLLSLHREISEDSGITYEALDTKVESIFGIKSNELLADQNLNTLHGRLSDSFIASKITKTASKENKMVLCNSLRTIELIKTISNNTSPSQNFNVKAFYNNAVVLPKVLSLLSSPQAEENPPKNPFDLINEDIKALETERQTYRNAYTELKKITVKELKAQYELEFKLLEERQKQFSLRQVEPVVSTPPQRPVPQEYTISCCCKKKCKCKCCCKCNKLIQMMLFDKQKEIAEDDDLFQANQAIPKNDIQYPDIYVLTPQLITKLSGLTQEILALISQNTTLSLFDAFDFIETKLIEFGNKISKLKNIKNNKRMKIIRSGDTTIRINTLLMKYLNDNEQ